MAKKGKKNGAAPEQDIIQEAGLPSNWQPVDAAPVIPGAPRPGAAAPVPNEMPPHFVGTLNPDMQHDKVFVGTQLATPRIASTPLMPTGPQGNPQSNAAIRSIIKINQSSLTTTSTGMNFRGVWLSFASYNVSDVVLFNQSAYVAITGSVNSQPDNNSSNWTLLSENFVFGASASPALSVGGFGPFDSSFSSAGNSNSVTFTAVPSFSNEIALLAVNAPGGGTIATPAGWQFLYASAGIPTQVFFYKILSGRSTLSVTASWTNTVNYSAYLAFFQFGGFVNVPISSIQIAANVLTVTCPNNFSAGNWVLFSGLTNATFLNGTVLEIATANSAQFTASFTHAAYGPTADTGTASLVIQQNGVQSSGAFTPPVSMTFPTTPKASSVLAFTIWSQGTDRIVFPPAPFTDLPTPGVNSYSSVVASTFGQSPTFSGSTAIAGFSSPNLGGVTGIKCPSLSIFDHTLSAQGSLTGANWYLLELPGSSQIVAKNFVPYDVFEFRGSFFVCLKETNLDAFADPTSWGMIAQGTGYVISLAANYAPTLTDYGRLIQNSTSSSFTVTLPSTPPSNSWWIVIENIGTGSIVVNPNGLLLDGSTSSMTLNQNQGLFIFTDGQNYFTFRGFTNVSLTMPPEFIVSGSPGMNIVVTKANENANIIAAGPASGSPAPWGFRAMVPADLSPLGVATAIATGVTTSQNGTLRLKGAVVPAGVYRVSAYFVLTNNPGAGTLDINIGWNDGTAARSATNGSNGMPADISTAATNFAQGQTIVKTDGINDITWAMTLT